MRCVAVIQARTGSTRLPGKVLLPLAGAPALQRMVERVSQARRVDDVIVATTVSARDDSVAALCESLGLGCVRGSESDVLSRYAMAAESLALDIGYLIRLTGDCPLIDPVLIDAAVSAATDGPLDYVTNTEPASWPDGLDVEVLSRTALMRAHQAAHLPSDREHVTPWIRRNIERKMTNCQPSRVDLSHCRWTLDEPEDYVLIAAVYSALYESGRLFTTQAVLTYLQSRPELTKINANFTRNESYHRAVSRERQQETLNDSE